MAVQSNLRGIPHAMDGLKPSQRKILFACLKRKLHSEIKVAQLAGYTSEHAAYHHGASISLLSQFAAEEEVLYPPNTMLVVQRRGAAYEATADAAPSTGSSRPRTTIFCVYTRKIPGESAIQRID